MQHLLEKVTAFRVFAVVFACLAFSTVCLEVTKIDIRFALMVQDMAEHGIRLFPTINGVEYCDYFSTWTILSYLTSFGGRFVNVFTLTLPTMLCGAYTVAASYAAGEKIRRGAGLYAALLSFATYEYMMSFTTFGLDIPVAAASVTMLYMFVTAKPWTCSLPVFVLLLFAVCAVRGPVGLVVFGAACGGFLLASGRWKEVFIFGVSGAVICALCGAGVYFAVRHGGSEELWKTFYAWQIGDKVSASKYSLAYYFTNAMGSFAPLTLFGIACFAFNWKRLLRDPYAGLLGFIILPLAMMSIPGCKHLRYITPVLSAFSVAGGLFVTEMIFRYGAYVEGKKNCVMTVRAACALFIMAFAALSAVAFFVLPRGAAPYVQCAVGVSICVLLALCVRGRDSGTAFSGIFTATGVFLVLGLIPFMQVFEGAEDFVSKSEKIRGDGRVFLFDMGPDHDDLKYIYNMPDPERSGVIYIFSKDPGGSEHMRKMYPSRLADEVLSDITPSDIIVTTQKRISRLKKFLNERGFVIYSMFAGRFGHRLGYAARVERTSD